MLKGGWKRCETGRDTKDDGSASNTKETVVASWPGFLEKLVFNDDAKVDKKAAKTKTKTKKNTKTKTKTKTKTRTKRQSDKETKRK